MEALVIDDSSATRAILSRMLRELGFSCQHAEHGAAALETCRTNSPFSLILVDWNMPVMNGLDFVKNFRQEYTDSPTTVVMVTTETDMSNVVMALEAGVNEYVMKPFTRDILAEKLKILGFDGMTER